MSLPPVTDLLDFIDASPSPYHAVATAAARLADAGFIRLDEASRWALDGGTGYYVERGGTLVAWSGAASGAAGPASPFRLVGAHTDSPNLRIKPHPERASAGARQLGVEVYGGALYNSWLDRDLGLSGRVVLRPSSGSGSDSGSDSGAGSGGGAAVGGAAGDGAGVAAGSTPEVRLVLVDRPLLRIPQLAIHLDRRVNETGLVLNAQQHLVPMWGLGPSTEGELVDFVAGELGVAAAEVVAFDLMTHDVAPATRLGQSDELVSAGRLDNLLSCWAAVSALVDVAGGAPGSPGSPGSPSAAHVPVVCLFDHEEIGSESSSGAGGTVLAALLERITLAVGGDRADHLQALAATVGISADGAHATHPNYPDRHDPQHRITLDGGPVIKRNANVRYATDAPSAAAFRLLAESVGVPVQEFVSRSDIPCGSTIGPMTAARLGIPVVDVGVAQLAMHSARELCGATDPPRLAAALSAFLAS